jgi:hypothetical protein
MMPIVRSAMVILMGILSFPSIICVGQEVSVTNKAALDLKDLALDPLSPELDLPKIKNWDTSFNLTSGAGYRDNVLFGNLNQQDSAFLRLGAEATLWRLPANGWEFYAYFLFEHLQYFDSPDVEKEQTAMAVLNIKKHWTNGWHLSLSPQYLYQDQIVDLSYSFTDLATLRVRGHLFMPKAAIRRDLGKHYWLECEALLNRDVFEEPVDDFWENGTKLSLGRDYGKKSEIKVYSTYSRRSYDTRPVTDADGIAIPGHGLVFDLNQYYLEWQHYWDAKTRFRSTFKLGMEQNRDNASGYYDYNKYQTALQLCYKDKKWDIRPRIRIARYEYPVQMISNTTALLRKRSDLIASIRIERKLTKYVLAYAEYEYERSLSNQHASEYSVNTINTGLYWEF